MAGWVLSALRLLGLTAGGALIGAGIDPIKGTGLALIDNGALVEEGVGVPKRRRRRRALTASDKNDIAFLAGIVGEPTARKFALILAAQGR
ncbi:hypothetical protein LCGC14_2062940 [marine sediment metagenome]|uniref:Uncharacterized protein n=1 Tax=marine sediment metagenome TaxID=412755 RepID=A0A0F9EKS1_9ZZZZ